MKDNLEAKFYTILLSATQQEFGEKIDKIEFQVDSEIENPSNSDVVDCSIFYKSASKKKTSSKAKRQDLETTTRKTSNARYSLDNFIVG